MIKEKKLYGMLKEIDKKIDDNFLNKTIFDQKLINPVLTTKDIEYNGLDYELAKILVNKTFNELSFFLHNLIYEEKCYSNERVEKYYFRNQLSIFLLNVLQYFKKLPKKLEWFDRQEISSKIINLYRDNKINNLKLVKKFEQLRNDEYFYIDYNFKSDTNPVNMYLEIYTDYDAIPPGNLINNYVIKHDEFIDIFFKILKIPKKEFIKSIENGNQNIGNKYVNFYKLYLELASNSCYSTPKFLFQLDIDDFINNYKTFKDMKSITIPAGAKIGLYSNFHGGGSIFECKLLEDLSFDLENEYIKIDDEEYSIGIFFDEYSHGYSLSECYGYEIFNDIPEINLSNFQEKTVEEKQLKLINI